MPNTKQPLDGKEWLCKGYGACNEPLPPFDVNRLTCNMIDGHFAHRFPQIARWILAYRTRLGLVDRANGGAPYSSPKCDLGTYDEDDEKDTSRFNTFLCARSLADPGRCIGGVGQSIPSPAASRTPFLPWPRPMLHSFATSVVASDASPDKTIVRRSFADGFDRSYMDGAANGERVYAAGGVFDFSEESERQKFNTIIESVPAIEFSRALPHSAP